MWWNPEVPSVTLMLRRSLSLKSQSTLDNKQLWHLGQSRSQILPSREFKWKPLQIDSLLLKAESEQHAKDRRTLKAIGQKCSALESPEASRKTEFVHKKLLVPSSETTDI